MALSDDAHDFFTLNECDDQMKDFIVSHLVEDEEFLSLTALNFVLNLMGVAPSLPSSDRSIKVMQEAYDFMIQTGGIKDREFTGEFHITKQQKIELIEKQISEREATLKKLKEERS